MSFLVPSFLILTTKPHPHAPQLVEQEARATAARRRRRRQGTTPNASIELRQRRQVPAGLELGQPPAGPPQGPAQLRLAARARPAHEHPGPRIRARPGWPAPSDLQVLSDYTAVRPQDTLLRGGQQYRLLGRVVGPRSVAVLHCRGRPAPPQAQPLLQYQVTLDINDSD